MSNMTYPFAWRGQPDQFAIVTTLASNAGVRDPGIPRPVEEFDTYAVTLQPQVGLALTGTLSNRAVEGLVFKSQRSLRLEVPTTKRFGVDLPELRIPDQAFLLLGILVLGLALWLRSASTKTIVPEGDALLETAEESPFPQIMDRFRAGEIRPRTPVRGARSAPLYEPRLTEEQMIDLGAPAEPPPRYRRGRT